MGNGNRKKGGSFFDRAAEAIIRTIYSIRKKRGRPQWNARRLERLRAVNPGCRPEVTAWEKDRILCKRIMMCAMAFGILSLAISVTGTGQGWLENGNTIARPQKNEGARQVEVTIVTPYGNYLKTLEVDSKPYTDEEIGNLFDMAHDEYGKLLAGGNTSLESVSEDLNFASSCSIEGMSASWAPDDPDLIDYNGTLVSDAPGVEADTSVHLTMSFEGRERTCDIALHLTPVSQTGAEAFITQLENQLESAVAETGDSIILPQEIEGSGVSYIEKKRNYAGYIALLGIVASVSMYFLQRQRLKEEAGRRTEALAKDYSALVSKLTILVCAGLSVRQSWRRMTDDYSVMRKGGAPARFVYEEMILTENAISQGTAEEKAYRQFGKRCGLPQYLRLGSLLETNARTGSKKLAQILRDEAQDAFTTRIANAKKRGEEISSKLLFPMIMLFGVVLLVLIVPAFMSF